MNDEQLRSVLTMGTNIRSDLYIIRDEIIMRSVKKRGFVGDLSLNGV